VSCRPRVPAGDGRERRRRRLLVRSCALSKWIRSSRPKTWA
jgi:hypothetical protein